MHNVFKNERIVESSIIVYNMHKIISGKEVGGSVEQGHSGNEWRLKD